MRSSSTDCPRPPTIDVETTQARCEAAKDIVAGYVASFDPSPAGRRRKCMAWSAADIPAALDLIDRLRAELASLWEARLQELVDEGRSAYDELLAEFKRLAAEVGP